MLVHEQFRSCVAFLRVETTNEGTDPPTVESTPIGTAFFVGVPVGNEHAAVYVVTAAHVVYAARSLTLPLQVRLAMHEGEPFPIDIADEAWRFHSKSDVAVASVKLPPRTKMKYMESTTLLTEEQADALRIGVGDDMFFVTLFQNLPGAKQDLPIVRFGHVARMPEEDVRIKLAKGWDVEVPAYLAEARSWGGQSGAPAFFYMGTDRMLENVAPDRVVVSTGHQGSIANVKGLAGLVHGHYPLKKKNKGLEAFGLADEIDINAGICIVIPSWTILETLDDPDLLRGRALAMAAIKRATEVPEPDDEAPDADVGLPEPGMKRDDFMAALEKVSKPKDVSA